MGEGFLDKNILAIVTKSRAIDDLSSAIDDELSRAIDELSRAIICKDVPSLGKWNHRGKLSCHY